MRLGSILKPRRLARIVHRGRPQCTRQAVLPLAGSATSRRGLPEGALTSARPGPAIPGVLRGTLGHRRRCRQAAAARRGRLRCGLRPRAGDRSRAGKRHSAQAQPTRCCRHLPAIAPGDRRPVRRLLHRIRIRHRPPDRSEAPDAVLGARALLCSQALSQQAHRQAFVGWACGNTSSATASMR